MAHHRNPSSRPSSQPCPACGQRTHSGSRFCSQCGSPLAHAQAGNTHSNQSSQRQADQQRDWQRQRQWLWQEEQRLLGQIAQEQARFTSHQATLGLLQQQQQYQQHIQRPKVVGKIVISALVGLHHSYAEQNYLYATRMLEQDVLRQQSHLVESASRLEALNATLMRVRTDILRLEALMGL